MNVIKKLIVVLSLLVCGNSLTYGYTFSQWASDNGLTGSETEIYAINAGITDLAGLANNYPNLTMLILWGSPLTSIQSGDFDGLGNLTEMYLNENQITSIESGDFVGLGSLKYLYLNDNSITSIESGDFNGLGNLERLDLGGNQITSIESGDFAGLGNLTDLYLPDNSITSIDSGDFDGPTNLIGLHLDNNQIADIESSDFAGLGNLTFLSLAGNQITSIDSGDFAALGNLNRLSLSGNPLTGIESGDFAGLGNLTELYLNDNPITSIESGDFDGPTNLTKLYLKNNLLTSIENGDFAALGNLTHLYLSDNQLTSIESGDFAGLGSLAELYLDGNQIGTMDFSNSDLSLLRCFDIVANPLTSMQLTDATLSQASFNALMNGGELRLSGIAEMPGVLDLNMSGVDFSGISHMSRMHTMDAIEELLLIDATNITGSDVSDLTAELASLNLLDVTGLWDTFDPASQSTLNAWDAIPGNVLVYIPSESDPPTPNPATFAVAPAADSDTAISMTATTGSDASGPVEYLFTETSGNPGSTTSAWRTSTSYTDSGLEASTQYTYTVTMRDSLLNTGMVSVALSATTQVSPVTVPDVTGQAQATAESNIVAAGLVVGTVTTSYSFVVPAGDVISQNPTGGASVPPGTSVDIEVSLGVQMVTVPDVVGLAQATAQSNIVAAALVVGTVTTSYSATVPAGDVISQNPVGSTSVAIGSSVDIEVSLGVQPVTVPDVVGQVQATAEGNIVAAGLVVGTVTTSYSFVVPAGDVISQNPTGGASVPPGTSVDIEVSLGVQMVTVPDVVGLAQATAQSNIVAAALVVGTVTTSYSATVPAGDVISQNPVGSTSVAIGSSVDIEVSLGAEPNTKLATGVVSGVGSSGWTTVNLAQSYTSMVVVAIANYDNTDDPGAVRIQDASGSSFQVRVDAAGGAALSGIDVHYMVVEEGVYTVAQDGVKMEAVKYLSTVTDENNSWVGQAQTYSNSYTSPVVLGQVMTYNDSNFTTFWCYGSARANPPDTTNLVTGKSVAEDTLVTRADETIGYIVIETGSGTINNTDYVAALGGDTVLGVADAPPYNYAISGLSSPSSAVAGLAAMDGGNGGWAVLYGASPLSASTLALAIDEDIIGDTERNHTAEQVAYIIFESHVADTTPPTPDPATFAVAPAADSDTAISMTATTGSDASGPVEYYFDETSGNPGATDSGWQTSTSYTDTGLSELTEYTYTVTMRDSLLNTGIVSIALSATTSATPVTVPDVTGLAQATAESNIVAAGLVVGTVTTSYSATVPAGDVISQNPTGGASVPPGTSVDIEVSLGAETDPPTPNPATFAVAPAADSDTAISMTATTGSDASGPVEYYFDETSGNPGGTDSGWQTSTSYTDSGLNASTQYTYTVTMRDGLANTGTASSGASATTDAGSQWTEIDNNDFESGWGIWNDGGSDCRRSSRDSSYAHQGNYCVRIRDNTSTGTTTTDSLNLSSYSEVKVDFWFYPRSMESNEDFWLQISTDGGSNFTTVADWDSGDEFSNGNFYSDSVIITGYTLTSNTRLRFRCDASSNSDYIYIDEVTVSAK